MLDMVWELRGCWAPPLLNRLMIRRLVWGLSSSGGVDIVGWLEW